MPARLALAVGRWRFAAVTEPEEQRAHIGILSIATALYGRLPSQVTVDYSADLYASPTNSLHQGVAALSAALGIL